MLELIALQIVFTSCAANPPEFSVGEHVAAIVSNDEQKRMIGAEDAVESCVRC